MERDEHHPLPPGIYRLEDSAPDPAKVDEAFTQLSCVLTPDEQKTVDRIREKYAIEHGLPFRISTEK
jgi:hypothetical protein